MPVRGPADEDLVRLVQGTVEGHQEWITRPLEVVDALFGARSASEEEQKEAEEEEYLGSGKYRVKEFFVKNVIENDEVAGRVPWLNRRQWWRGQAQGCNGEVRHGQLVRVICMVQDMADVEYYMEAHPGVKKQEGNAMEEEKEGGTGWWTGKYRDGHENMIAVDEEACVKGLRQRKIFHCVGVPGESGWVGAMRSGAEEKEGEMIVESPMEMEATENGDIRSGSVKRKCADTEERDQETDVTSDDASKRSKPLSHYATSGKSDLSFVLKVYDDEEEDEVNDGKTKTRSPKEMSLHDVIEVYGVVHLDNTAASSHLDPAECGTMMKDLSLEENSSTAFRLASVHSITYRILKSHNPLLANSKQVTAPTIADAVHPVCEVCAMEPAQVVEAMMNRIDSVPGALELSLPVISVARQMREVLISHYLSPALGGDRLASEYLVSHFVSRVHTYLDDLNSPLGNMCLSLSNIHHRYPDSANRVVDVAGGHAMVKHLVTNVIEQILPSSVYIPMAIERLNKARLVPTKCYESNRILQSELQIPNGTYLVLDESQMEEGRLDAVGVRNIRILANMIKNQVVEYDYTYFQLPVKADIPVLCISEGSSIFTPYFNVPLMRSGKEAPSTAHRGPKSVDEEALLNAIRLYISAIRLVPAFEISNEMCKRVECDLVQMRKKSRPSGQSQGEQSTIQESPGEVGTPSVTPEPSFGPEDMHMRLSLSRHVALSIGEKCLTEESWMKVQQMEEARLERVDAMEALKTLQKKQTAVTKPQEKGNRASVSSTTATAVQ